jgi:hypothetical protein
MVTLAALFGVAALALIWRVTSDYCPTPPVCNGQVGRTPVDEPCKQCPRAR